MSLLSELKTIIEGMNIPVETGVFNDVAPDTYCVLTPMTDTYVYADNTPMQDVSEVRISLFDKGNYLSTKGTMERLFLAAEITITDRRYISHDDEIGYHHYAIDVAKNYEIQEET